jgi:hypothetical protein
MKLGEPLSDDARATCADCGARTFLYKTPNGSKVALQDTPGPYVISGDLALLQATDAGFGKHSEHCTHRLGATLIRDPTEAEFIWGRECGD